MYRRTTVPNRQFTDNHLELCEKGAYQVILLDFLRSGYGIKKIDLSHYATDMKDIPAKKGDRSAMMAIKR